MIEGQMIEGLYLTVDSTGANSVHYCQNPEQAKQLHLCHFGLFSADFVLAEKTDMQGIACQEGTCQEYLNQLVTAKFKGFE